MAFKIAVTGVGGGVGQSILKSLQHTDYELVALDSELLATGLYSAKKAYIIPYAKADHYIEQLLEICLKEKIDILFPGLDAELMILANNKDKFEAIGTQIIVSSPKVIETANDKLKTYKRLTKKGIKVPYTCSLHEFDADNFSFPIIVKPKKGGARSKDVYKLESKKELRQIWNKLKGLHKNYIAMQFIDGDEYTCGTISIEDRFIGSISMKRTLRDGDTFKCFVEKNPIIENYLEKIIYILKPFGACNIQLKFKDNIPYIFEINARCSGTTSSRTLAGFNEPKMIADFLLKKIEPRFEIKELSILRYWNELIIDNNEIATLHSKKAISRKKHIFL